MPPCHGLYAVETGSSPVRSANIKVTSGGLFLWSPVSQAIKQNSPPAR